MGELTPTEPEEAEVKSNERVALGPEDRQWMEGSFGCDWPADEDQEAWLIEANNIIRLGSRDLRGREKNEDYDEIISARLGFLALLPGIKQSTIRKRPDHDLVELSQGTTWITALPNVFIENQRLLYSLGVNGARVVNGAASTMRMTAARTADWFEKVDALGLDAVALTNDAPQVQCLAPESIRERLQVIASAARLAGYQDPVAAARDFVKAVPVAISYSPHKTRVITRILAEGVGATDETSSLRNMYIVPIEATLVAHLERKNSTTSHGGLNYQASRNYRNRSKAELLSVIATHAELGSRAVKTYLTGYPIDDLEAAKEVYQRHIRARDRRKEYPLLWTGPAILGDAESIMSPNAYMHVIQSPDLTDEQFDELGMTVCVGRQAEQELRDMSVRHDEDEIRERLETMEHGKKAGQALVARNLELVTEIAKNCSRHSSLIELIAIGNVALVSFVQEDVETWLDVRSNGYQYFKRCAVAAIMRSLTGYWPRYQGVDLSTLEKSLAGNSVDSRLSGA